ADRNGESLGSACCGGRIAYARVRMQVAGPRLRSATCFAGEMIRVASPFAFFWLAEAGPCTCGSLVQSKSSRQGLEEHLSGSRKHLAHRALAAPGCRRPTRTPILVLLAS